MSKLIPTRTAQYPMLAVFEANFDDTMVDINGVEKAFKAGGTFDVIPLPPNGEVVGGALVVQTASNDSGTATITVGDSGSATRYLGSTTLKSAARTPLVPTGYRGNGEKLRLTIAAQNGDATAGKFRVNAEFIVKDRVSENQLRG